MSARMQLEILSGCQIRIIRLSLICGRLSTRPPQMDDIDGIAAHWACLKALQADNSPDNSPTTAGKHSEARL